MQKLFIRTCSEEIILLRRHSTLSWDGHSITLLELLPSKSIPRRSPNSPDKSAYFRQQVLLHVPCDNDWETLYRTLVHTQVQLEIPVVEDEYEDADEDSAQDVEEWMVIAGAGPHGEIGPNVEIGRREMDVEYNWTESFYQYTNGLNLPSFVTEQKLSTAEDEPVWDAPNVSFSNEQQAILDLLSRQFQSIETGVDSICSQLNQLLGPDSFRLLAPTDAAAVNVNGSTIHSGLSISIGKYDNFIDQPAMNGTCLQYKLRSFHSEKNLRLQSVDIWY
ncbi:hypothetical protein M8J75_016409 [Diaphorina citri]|nr:hypothetical protein M8J75_016409 [Diaphorina citri]